MGKPWALQRKYKFKIIEDAAQAHGARYKGRRVGNLGNVAAFSFYPGKNLGALGDGGCITTNDQKFYAVLGAHIGADLGIVSLNVWARNLTDTKYNTFAFSSKATGKEMYIAQRGNPFQIGLDVRMHF